MRVGIIGCGAIARRAHIPVFRSLPGVELWAVADSNGNLAKATADRFGVKNYFKDYRQLLKDDSISLVSICTPSITHTDIAIDSASRGKNILIEKPLALSLQDAWNIVKEADRNGVKLCVVQNFRYSPTALKVKSRIEGGYLGRIVSVHGTAHTRIPLMWTRTTWHYHEGGALDDFGPHLLDLILWLSASKVVKISAFGGDFLESMNFINNIQILMEFESKTLATADISWLGNTTLFTVHVQGTGGQVQADINQNHFVELHGSQTPVDDLMSFLRKMRTVAKGSITGNLFRGGLALHEPLIMDFIKSIECNSTVPVSGEEALQNVAVSEAAKKSLKEGRTVFLHDLMESTREQH